MNTKEWYEGDPNLHPVNHFTIGLPRYENCFYMQVCIITKYSLMFVLLELKIPDQRFHCLCVRIFLIELESEIPGDVMSTDTCHCSVFPPAIAGASEETL